MRRISAAEACGSCEGTDIANLSRLSTGSHSFRKKSLKAEHNTIDSSVLASVLHSEPVWRQFNTACSILFLTSRSCTMKCGSEPETPPHGGRASSRLTEPLGCRYFSDRASDATLARLRVKRCTHASGM